MTTLGDALNNSFAADARRENLLDAGRTVGAIRRRRAARAAGVGTAAAVGVGAAGAAWWLMPGGRFASPAQPAPTTNCTDAELYLPPNPAALGDVDILFRAYIDLRPDSHTAGVIVVLPDGTRVRVEPDANGEYSYDDGGEARTLTFPDMPDDLRYRPEVSEYLADGSGGGDFWDGVTPPTEDYEWTVTVPSEVPDGVDTAWLSSTLRIALGMGGSGYSAEAVPEGAVADELLTTTSGVIEGTRLYEGDPGMSLEGRDDVESIALRVTLADGETFTIVARHHEVDPALTACAPASTSAAPTASAEPTGIASPEPGVSSGPEPSMGGVCYAPGNPAAFGALDYVGRSYIDEDAGVYAFVRPDGTREDLTLGADGTLAVEIDGTEQLVWSTDAPHKDGLIHADWFFDGDGFNGTGYPSVADTWSWNVDVPQPVPAGVDAAALSEVLLWSMFNSGTDLQAADIPAGATVQFVASGDGRDFAIPLAPGMPTPGHAQLDGYDSLALKVTLADGSDYTIAASFDPTSTEADRCELEPLSTS